MEKEGKAPNSALVRFDDGLFKVMKWISYVSAVCLLVITLLSTADVIADKFIGKGITNAMEIVTYLNIPVVFLSTAFVQLERGHTHIDLIYVHFPMWAQKLIHTIGNILGVGLSVFVGYRAVILTTQKIATKAMSSAAQTAFAVWPFVAVFAFGFALMAIAFLWSLFREFLLPPRMNFDPAAAPDEEPGKEGQA